MNIIKNFLLWFFSVIFIIGGLGNLGMIPLYGMACVILGLCMNPKFSKFLQSKNITVISNRTTKQKWIMGIGLLFGSIILSTIFSSPQNLNNKSMTFPAVTHAPTPTLTPTPIPLTNLYAADGRVIKNVPTNKIGNYGTGWLTEEQKIARDAEIKIEKARALEIEKHAQSLRNIIKIYSVTTSDPNSAGGVDFSVVWKNTSQKTIKYISFAVEPYNRVGDVVGCSIRGFRLAGGKVTGPINPKETYGEGYSWENMWYNNSIVKAKLIRIIIEYMDGTIVDITNEDLKYIF